MNDGNLARQSRRLLPFLGVLLLIAAISTLGPPERSLGEHVRLVYLHGAWVWTSIAGFGGAAFTGLAALLRRDANLDSWSIALGRAGLFFWITYLPLTVLTARLNWNGLFLEEPRWRMAVNLALVGIAFQIALLVIQQVYVGSVLSIGFLGLMIWSLATTEQILHPRAPIASSGSSSIQLFFAALTALCFLAGFLLTRWLKEQTPSSSA